MAFVKKNLIPGEKILFQASVSKFAYVWAMVNFALSFLPLGLARLATTELALTDKRVIGKTGRHTVALPYKDISVISVRQGLFGRLFDVGAVVISGKDGSSVKFKSIVWPLVFQQEANDAIEIAILGKKLSDFADEESNQSIDEVHTF